MGNVSIEIGAGHIEGFCDSRFRGVLEQFIENFERHGEVGANVALTLEGKMLVDLWGGRKAPKGEAWTRDTMTLVFSCTKGAAALCAHFLVDRGLLDLDAPVSCYWPEYAQNGKEETLVSMLLDHTSGLPHVKTPVKQGGFYDYDHMVSLIEKEAPFWRPGTRTAYQAFTPAWLVGEVVRRITGKTIGQFFRSEFAVPLGLDFWIGLPETEEARVAPVIDPIVTDATLGTNFTQAIIHDPTSVPHLFSINNAGIDFNARACHAAEIGSANGITNGRAHALLYTPFANVTAKGPSIVSRDTLMRMSQVSSAAEQDGTLYAPTRFALGFMKTLDNRKRAGAMGLSFLVSDAAFGHVGLGGAVGFADPECRMAFGYNMNQKGESTFMNERGQALVDAAYLALGYRSNAGGAWAM